MKFFLDNSHYIDTSTPLDLSLPLAATENNPRAWYVDRPTFEPVRTEHYTGSVAEGGSVNFRNIYFNPHGHGTHTECLGHITEKVHSINTILQQYFFKARVITIDPKVIVQENGDEDRVIVPEQLDLNGTDIEALIIRTTPNFLDKKTMNYSSSNPIYFDVACVEKILAAKIDHLLVDLPSVDRENDGGELVFHHAFWEVPENPNHERTITELIFVEDSIEDGEYILSFQVAPFENDAAPSRPVLYQIKKD
ncbi:MAG: cyclase family protein [Crocinitomicaceae bacterium]|nr:cyclase family protein [Crocinitomicaceae bacterium]